MDMGAWYRIRVASGGHGVQNPWRSLGGTWRALIRTLSEVRMRREGIRAAEIGKEHAVSEAGFQSTCSEVLGDIPEEHALPTAQATVGPGRC